MSTTGLCTTKCPKEEIDFRIRNRLLHPLECINPFGRVNQRQRVAIVERICKSYRRPAADQIIRNEEVRTLSALKETVDYLFDLENEYQMDSQFALLYEFLADRYRAVRQDIIVQRLNDDLTSSLFEQMICFYIRAKYRAELCKISTYDAVLHARELDENFARWRHFGKKSDKMRILYLLHSINNPDIFRILRSYREFIDVNEYKQLCNLFSAYTLQNYVQFFRIVNEFAGTLRSQLLMPAIEQMRLHAFEAILASNKSPMCSIPVDIVQQWLSLGRKELEKCVNDCFEKSPITEQAFKCHGCKLKSSIVFSFDWVLIDRSQHLIPLISHF